MKKLNKKTCHIFILDDGDNFTVDIQSDIHPAKVLKVLLDIEEKIYEEKKDEIHSYVQKQERQNLQS